jgi:hypothetical protein
MAGGRRSLEEVLADIYTVERARLARWFAASAVLLLVSAGALAATDW